MNNNLPDLDTETLNSAFERVYEFGDPPHVKDLDDKPIQFYYLLKVMQRFNFRFRQDDYSALYEWTHPIFNYSGNSEGTDLWLSLILAIKELYGLSNTALVKILRQVTVRH